MNQRRYPTARAELLQTMKHLAGSLFGEPLKPGHELSLWEIHQGENQAPASVRARLQRRCREAGGWWLLLDEGPRFVPLEEWRHHWEHAM